MILKYFSFRKKNYAFTNDNNLTNVSKSTQAGYKTGINKMRKYTQV